MTDHELLTRMAQTSRSLGIVAAQGRCLNAWGAQLPPEALREIGAAVRSLSDALLTRADELEQQEAMPL